MISLPCTCARVAVLAGLLVLAAPAASAQPQPVQPSQPAARAAPVVRPQGLQWERYHLNWISAVDGSHGILPIRTRIGRVVDAYAVYSDPITTFGDAPWRFRLVLSADEAPVSVAMVMRDLERDHLLTPEQTVQPGTGQAVLEFELPRGARNARVALRRGDGEGPPASVVIQALSLQVEPH